LDWGGRLPGVVGLLRDLWQVELLNRAAEVRAADLARFSERIVMAEKIRTVHWKTLYGRLGEVAYEITKVHFSQYRPGIWCPAINAYLVGNRIEICVDLAGVDKAAINLSVEPNRLILRGRREPIEPDRPEEEAVRILAMEIDCGEFERQVMLSPEVDAGRVTAEQRNGFLWVYLPLRAHG
jgi:HSP20 family protein